MLASVSALVLAVLTLAQAQQASVTASVNAHRIGIEDVLQLTVSISGGSPTAAPELPTTDGFRVGGRSTSQSIELVNGKMSSTRSYIYQLLPQREGRFTIGPVRVEVGGRTEETDPIDVEVVSGSVAPSRGRSGRRALDPFDPFGSFGGRRDQPQLEDGDVFVRAEVSKRSLFQGEQVVVTYRVFSRYLPLGPEIEDDPPLEGFWVEEVDLGSQPTAERRTVDGKQYIVFPIKQRVLFPTRAGKLTIPPLTFSMAFRVTSGDPFDAFFSRASSPVSVRSSPVELDVKPLPASGRSREFKGAVGRFDFEAELSQEAIDAGDPVTLTLTVAGSGNLRRIEPAELPELAEFRAFAPKTDEKARAGANGLSGTKTWEYVLVPESGGVKEVGPFSFQYFDPEKAAYVTASAGPLELHVAGGALSASDLSSGAAPRSEVTVLRQDIRYLKDPPPRLGSPETPFHRTGLFYLTLVLPVLWNVGFIVYRRREEKERTHSQLFRSRRAHRMARERLKQAKRLEAEASRDFYEEVAAALYRFVGDKLSVSPSGLTSSSIDSYLESARVPEELRRELLSVLATCEEARFTPGTRTREEMTPLRERAETLIVALARHLA